ncbi:NUDIX domain-containing protein [Asaia lannensis]|uniref:NUDIX domain-containing protein n=1 Tax=Asaia lannensis NBRC 102526 TaxID=1307926 RepID=A0ABT1CL05_9PROT|nr:NUDIX domain-containing protein [Asaia lannensis]MCO6160888.1 NUDIX domain-containing protein [Asaia lannensis NBRC 102526]GBR01526.1 phosphohydrolase [Asaia lannensis NBRC 102526]
MSVIIIAAALLHDGAGRILLVRKRNTQAFMQPGGKIEPGETPQAALLREIEEELGVRASSSSCRFLKRIEAPAANEPGHIVRAELFALLWQGDVTVAAEIAEARWVTPDEAQSLVLAPLTRDCVLPLCPCIS